MGMKKREWLVNSRASVCRWSLQAEFLAKEQVRLAVHEIMKNPIDFDFSCSRSHNDGRDVFVLTVENMSWASNLKTIAKILARVDHHIE